MQSTLKNMVLVLGSITLIASAAVGGVYILTKVPIEQAQIAKTNSAISDVMPGFDNDPSAEAQTVDIDGKKVKVYPAAKGGEPLGYAIETFTNNGFGGEIKLMVGILTDGTIKSISVLEQKETPGLGDKIEPAKSNFAVQFSGKSPENFNFSVTKDGGDVDAITASTFTSRAFSDAVERAFEIYKKVKDQ